MKILYVEDNEDNIYVLKNRLSRAGFTVPRHPRGASRFRIKLRGYVAREEFRGGQGRGRSPKSSARACIKPLLRHSAARLHPALRADSPLMQCSKMRSTYEAER
jgi:hypothetical protein